MKDLDSLRLTGEEIHSLLIGRVLRLHRISQICIDPHPNRETPCLEDVLAQAQIDKIKDNLKSYKLKEE